MISFSDLWMPMRSSSAPAGVGIAALLKFLQRRPWNKQLHLLAVETL
jgi:hypothetical protein